MNRFEVEATKLRKVANRTAVKQGFDEGTISISCLNNTLHICLWKDGDIVGSRSNVPPTIKMVKQTMHELVRECRNSQS